MGQIISRFRYLWQWLAIWNPPSVIQDRNDSPESDSDTSKIGKTSEEDLPAIVDTVLAFDPADDLIYRIQRDEADGSSRIIYVTVDDPEIIPEFSRSCKPDAIRELRKVPRWYENWDTLMIRRESGEIRSYPNEFGLHRLAEQNVLGDYERFNVLDFTHSGHYKINNVFRVILRDVPCILKVAHFPHQLHDLRNEVRAYHRLMENRSCLAPKLLGYAYEGNYSRVMGILLEEVRGRRPFIEDFELCQRDLRQLHELDLLHGDLNPYNMNIRDDKLKFFDFEASCVGPEGTASEWEERKDQEVQSLHTWLQDESGTGQPWTEVLASNKAVKTGAPHE